MYNRAHTRGLQGEKINMEDLGEDGVAGVKRSQYWHGTALLQQSQERQLPKWSSVPLCLPTAAGKHGKGTSVHLLTFGGSWCFPRQKVTAWPGLRTHSRRMNFRLYEDSTKVSRLAGVQEDAWISSVEWEKRLMAQLSLWASTQQGCHHRAKAGKSLQTCNGKPSLVQ